MTEQKKSFRFPLYLQILLGMIAGIVFGIIALQFGGGIKFVKDWIYPWGRLFIRLLQLIAVPLVIVSLVKGMIGLKDIAAFSRMGWKALVFYLFTSILAVSIGLSAGLLVKPGKIVDKTKVEHIREAYETVAAEKEQAAELSKEKGPLAFIEDIVPNNIFSAAAENGRMLQVIFFILFFGLAALTVPPDKIKPVVVFFDALNDIILRMVDFVIRFAPYGVTALMAGIVTDFGGDISIFSALGVYALCIVGALLLLMFFFYPLIVHFFTDVSVKKFLQSMYPVQLFAFTTSSSAATLPLTMKVVEEKLGVSQEIASFILPVGATVNMDGTSCYQTIAVLFIAQVLGIDLSISQLLIVVGMCVISSIGTPAIPSGSFVILSIVLISVGIPAEGLALILGIDRPLDMLRTSVNVTGDSVIASFLSKKQPLQ
jgi:Na+/H+-dicarboxylate symporter